ncbi:MAG: hypothetical protein Q8M02_02630 [Candidatus Didemnitutus sp.]|nr:hypothetical protein [Candidatus Didemnitutus sp.]
MLNRNTFLLLLAPLPVLLVPLVAMQFTHEVNWTPRDFLAAWILLAGAGLAFRFAIRHALNLSFKIGAALAVVTALALMWANLAVGLIGREGNPANLFYGGVLAIGIVGALLARGRPTGMERTLFAMAFAQILVPVIAVVCCATVVHWRELIGNALFALLFITSALFFRFAAHRERCAAAEKADAAAAAVEGDYAPTMDGEDGGN